MTCVRLFVLLGSLAGWVATAEAGPLFDSARAAYDRVEYPEAIVLLERALAGEALQPGELENAYYLLGSAELGAGDVLGADHAFETLVALQPSFQPERDAPPKVVEGIRVAQSRGTTTARVVHDPSRDRASRGNLEIEAELSAAHSLQPAIEYHDGAVADRIVRATLGCVGARCTTRIPGSAGSYRLGFLTAEGAFALATQSYEPSAAPRQSGVHGTVDKPLYKRWWLWTIVGVVVAGGVAGATAGALYVRASHSVDFVVQKTCAGEPCGL